MSCHAFKEGTFFRLFPLKIYILGGSVIWWPFLQNISWVTNNSLFFGATFLKTLKVTLAVTALMVLIFLQGTTTVSSVAILFLLARPLTLPGRAHLALNCLLGVAAGQVRKLRKWYTTCRHLKSEERGPTCSLLRRRNFTPVSNVCEAAPISCSVPLTDSTNYRKCISNLLSYWLANRQWLFNRPFMRVLNRFYGIRDFPYLKLGIRDLRAKSRRDSGLKVCGRVRMPEITPGITGLHKSLSRDYGSEEPYWGPSIMAHTQILLHRWGPRTKISALFCRRTEPRSLVSSVA